MGNTRGVMLGAAIVIIVALIIVIEQPWKDDGKEEAQTAEQQELVPKGDKDATGEYLRHFTFTEMDGKKVDLSKFTGNQALMLNAWAAWCPFCVEEIPRLQRASNEFDSVTVIFIHRTSTEDEEEAREFVKSFSEEHNISITDPVVMDKKDKFYKEYFGFGMPVTLYVTKEGKINGKKVGPLTDDEIRQKMEELS